MKVIGENRIADLWDRIKNYVDPKADKIPEVNHGTSDTTFTLTPNIMHIWGEVSSLTLSLSTDTNSVLDEYLFTFTCPSAAATTLTLPSTVKWIQEPNLTAGKTYQVSIINGLAGYLTDDMEISGGDENIIEEIKVNGTTLSVVDKAVNITVPQGTVTSVTVNGSNYTPDTNGLVNLGTISGGEGGSGGEYNVIEGVTFNGTSAPITNKIAAITYTAPTLSKGTTTGNGNAVTDITVNGHEITLTKGTTFLTSHQDISGKADDSLVVHKAGNETITGNKIFQFGTTTAFDGDIEIGQSYIRGTQNQGNFDFIVSDDQGTDRSLQDALDAKAPAEYSYTTANENYVAIGDTINQCITELDDAVATKVSSSDITSIVKITLADYDLLSSPSSTTLYIIIPASS